MSFKNLSESEMHRLVGQRIRAARVRAGLTAFEVIRSTGITKSLYYTYEIGQGPYTISNLNKITGAVGCTLSELFRTEEEERQSATAYDLEKKASKATHLATELMMAGEGTARLMGELLAAMGGIQQMSAGIATKPGAPRSWSEEISATEGVKLRSRKQS